MGSGVIAGIISAAVSLYSGHRQNTLSRITDERTKRRAEIKQIAFDLQAHIGDEEATKVDLAKLSAQLNPYGKFNTGNQNDQSKGDIKFYLQDGFIWEAITEYDGKDSNKLEILKDRIYLAMQYDLEQSREEIRMTTVLARIFAFVLAALGGAFLSMNISGNTELEFSLDLLLVCGYIVVLVGYPILATRFQNWPVTIIVALAEAIFLGITFIPLCGVINYAKATGPLALAFCFFSLLTTLRSEFFYIRIRIDFLTAAKKSVGLNDGNATSTPNNHPTT